MSITVRRSLERGHANHGWLDSYHTFSFADYMDPRHMSFRSLRVINEDRIAGDNGFGMHPHKDMEILTYVIEGKLQHEDSMGNKGIINAGDIQKMSAGSGVTHSEINASKTDKAYLLQIWISPNAKGIKPSYQQMSIMDLKAEGLQLIASGQAEGDVIKFEQDVDLYRGYLPAGSRVVHSLKHHGAWIQMVKGEISLGDDIIRAGDAAAFEKESKVHIEANKDAEFLLFDLK